MDAITFQKLKDIEARFAALEAMQNIKKAGHRWWDAQSNWWEQAELGSGEPVAGKAG